MTNSDREDRTDSTSTEHRSNLCLEVNDISAGYDKKIVIEDVSLDVFEDEVVAIVGRNGAGKTTTLRAITGNLIPYQGQVNYRGDDVTQLGPVETTKKGIVLVPEERRIFPQLTVRENLEIASYSAGSESDWEIESVLDLFPNLEGALSRPGSSLSGGEQQMLAIARGLMANPSLLLLDEPTEGLAPKIIDTVRDTIENLSQSDLPILLVEQNVEVTTQIADRIYVVDRGRIVFGGTVEEFASNSEVRDRHLGVTMQDE